MNGTAFQIVGIGVVLAAAGFVQGLTGFGFAIVGMALLPLLQADWQASLTLVAVNSILIPVVLLKRHGGGFSLRPALGLTLGTLIGTYLGFHFTTRHSEGGWFIRLFGVVLFLFSAFDLWQGLRKSPLFVIHKRLALPFGLAGGFFGGAFNISGPPIVAYAYSQPWGKSQTVATLQVVFMAGAGYRMLLMGTNGFFEPQVLNLLLWTTPATLTGLLLGSHLLNRADQTTLRTGVFLMVGLLGLVYAILGPRIVNPPGLP
jgi:uncharacterized membrane protein YfcA